MNYFDLYKKRLDLKGTNQRESITNSTSDFINKNFENDPNYYIVSIDGEDTEALISTHNESDKRTVLLRPNTKKPIGSVVTFKTDTYLVIETEYVHDVNCKCEMQLCNSTFKLKGQTEKVQIGVDPIWGTPIYDETSTSDTSIPCIVENKILQSNSDEAINLPNNQLVVTIPFMIHEDIEYDKTFQMFGDEYKIVGFDKTIKGLLKIYGKRVGADVV